MLRTSESLGAKEKAILGIGVVLTIGCAVAMALTLGAETLVLFIPLPFALFMLWRTLHTAPFDWEEPPAARPQAAPAHKHAPAHA